VAYDLLLKDGTLIDPADAMHARKDVAFRTGVVAAVGDSIDAKDAARVLDCAGRIVAPGMIDLHVHAYAGVSHYGIPP
jgi:dihydroorotase